MDPTLNCSDPKYKSLLGLNNVGFRLENAGLVKYNTLYCFLLIQFSVTSYVKIAVLIFM
jgi:hypothetical protein